MLLLSLGIDFFVSRPKYSYNSFVVLSLSGHYISAVAFARIKLVSVMVK